MSLPHEKLKELNERSRKLRLQVFEYARKPGCSHYHFGGALSTVEILVCLYNEVLNENDVFIMSKGHGCLAWYPLLEERGFRPDITKEHPDRDPKNGIYCTSGSLGHGLPIAVGAAMARKMQGKPGHFYVLLGEAEFQEGTGWESLLHARQQGLDNLTGIVDYNRSVGSGWADEILSLGKVLHGETESLESKLRAFGANVITINGHSHEEIIRALSQEYKNKKPIMIVANTIKGKGVSYMESAQAEWHAKLPTPEQFDQAITEIEKAKK